MQTPGGYIVQEIDSKDRSSGTGVRVKSGAQPTISVGQYHRRGQSTDISSLPLAKSQPKSQSDISGPEIPYVQVKLTKDVLHVFEEQTKTSSVALIREYLNRCDQEPGEIDGLLTEGSSEDSGRRSSSEPEDSEESSDDGEDSQSDDERKEDQEVDPPVYSPNKNSNQRQRKLIEALESFGGGSQQQDPKLIFSQKKHYRKQSRGKQPQ